MNKTLKIFVPLFLVFVFVFSYIAPFIETSENISDQVFRLHILANSDSAEDQQLKLKVRDEILKKGEKVFASSNSLEETIELCKDNIALFQQTAEQCLKDNGSDYDVKVYVDKEYFNTREYDEITLPSGIYNALKIEIGQGKGHNWWCVMFPAICLSSVTDDELNKYLSEDEQKLVNSDSKYEVRFKIVEIYEKVKSKIISE
uniref:stage II sporulation protein R n=1 Tax=Eubacterium sp. TaxID=142586 RepID=UPI004028832F